VIALFAPPLVQMAQQFGSHEYVALMVLGLVAAVILASGSFIKALAMVVLGVLLGQVNSDVISGVARFSFDRPELSDGFGVVVVAMGVFGFGELIAHLSRGAAQREAHTRDVHGLMPTPVGHEGGLPRHGAGYDARIAARCAAGQRGHVGCLCVYTIEKKLAKDPSRFGKGAIEGVAAPESANNAGAQVSFVPLLVLGIPPNGVMALMAGAMVLKGIQPGPQVMTANPELFWGLIASMWIGN
jgi:putative tricarboxylic transport membrane protein